MASAASRGPDQEPVAADSMASIKKSRVRLRKSLYSAAWRSTSARALALVIRMKEKAALKTVERVEVTPGGTET